MADLRGVFGEAGYEGVRTYIQSGNVLFESESPGAQLEGDIERLLAEYLGVKVVVVVRSRRQLSSIVASAPEGFATNPEMYLSDVVFLKRPLTATKAMAAVNLREGVDQAWAGRGVLYFRRVADRASQSRFSRLASTPEYRLMTIRNWATSTRLLAMMTP